MTEQLLIKLIFYVYSTSFNLTQLVLHILHSLDVELFLLTYTEPTHVLKAAGELFKVFKLNLLKKIYSASSSEVVFMMTNGMVDFFSSMS